MHNQNESYAAEQWFDSVANDYYDRTEDVRDEEQPDFESEDQLRQDEYEAECEAEEHREHFNVADLVAGEEADNA